MIALDTPPQTTLTIGAPQYSSGPGQQVFVTSKTPFTLQAEDSNFSVQSISYEYVTAPQPTTQQGSFAQFTIAAPASDGIYNITWFATNAAGVVEGTHTSHATLDNTPPVITIVQPAAIAYPHSSTLTLNYSVSDGSGSGVKTVTPALLDRNPAIGGNVLASGLSINLLRQLTLGSHTFTFGGAVDNLGNTAPAQTVTFSVVATASSILGDVSQFIGSGDITDANWANSLTAKLNAAAAERSTGSCGSAASVYSAFINEVSAQTGKKVSSFAPGVMIADAQYLIANCP